MSVVLALAALAGLAWLFIRPPHTSPVRGDAPRLPPAPDPRELPGGTPERAIAVPSPAVIEARAAEDPCRACGTRVHCDHHRVEVHGGQRYRVADIRCTRCGFERPIYFVLET